MHRIPTALIAGLTLVAGFAAARVTDLPVVGGAVVLGGAAWCVLREVRRTAWWRIVVVVVVAAGCFVGSHVAADVLGAWPAVLVAAVVVAGVTHLLVAGPGVPVRPVRST